ncbi:MAG: NUDIX domain-containing protein [Candidatus Magasanikbacteria bacterium]
MDNSKLHIVAITGYLRKGDQFLILKRSPNEIAFPSKWTIPGGKVEGASSVVGTLKREILEETGLGIKDKVDFFSESEFTRPDGYHVLVLSFICEYDSGEVQIEKDSFSEFAWINKETFTNYDLIEGIKKDFNLLFNK